MLLLPDLAQVAIAEAPGQTPGTVVSNLVLDWKVTTTLLAGSRLPFESFGAPLIVVLKPVDFLTLLAVYLVSKVTPPFVPALADSTPATAMAMATTPTKTPIKDLRTYSSLGGFGNGNFLSHLPRNAGGKPCPAPTLHPL